MRIKRLKIKKFKNLRNFEISFDKDSFTSVIVGRNGTGKSNILEALISIFRDLNLRETPGFTFELEYSTRHANLIFNIQIDFDKDRPSKEQMKITIERQSIDGKPLEGMLLPSMSDEISYSNFHRNREIYLPRYVFGYYSGPSNRMEGYFEKHQDDFADSLLRGDDKPLRPLLYARNLHSQFVLMAFFERQSEDEKVSEFLREKLRIIEFDSVLFILHKPYWSKSNIAKTNPHHWNTKGDPRFWGARGVVQTLLANLYRLSYPPIHQTRVRIRQSFFKKYSSTDLKYLYLPNKEALSELATNYESSQEFFKALESMFVSDLIEKVLVKVIVKNADGSLSFHELSEGEQQLLMVLGLLRFTQEEESLFLLDEPDTHLNPAWSFQYIDAIREIAGEQNTSQIIMTTHDPLVLSSLKKEQVRILYYDQENRFVKVETPEDDPSMMGYGEILTSSIFGMPSILGTDAQEKLDRFRYLNYKKSRTTEEDVELGTLAKELENLKITSTTTDSHYDLFVESMIKYENEKYENAQPLSPEEQRERQEKALELIRQELEKG